MTQTSFDDTRSAPAAAEALDRAHAAAVDWLTRMPERGIPATTGVAETQSRLGLELPTDPEPPGDVIDVLIRAVEPGLMASQSSRFFGWVMGGTLPASLAADWLVSAWDQNAGMREVTTGVVAAEDLAGRWLCELLGLDPACDVGFTTGATMANLTGLAAARTRVLRDAGWDADERGLAGGPPIRFLAGAERHGSVDLAARLLGLGAAELIDADDQGRIRPDLLAEALAGGSGPTILALQAGNVHSGAFDPFAECVAVAHDAGAWVHVDGAFGLWAGASPRSRHLMRGAEDADSWATDAHKTLNVPYDCGVAIVRDRVSLRQAMGTHASYLTATTTADADPHERVPEMSRRARGVPVWAALRSLGTSGVAALIDRLTRSAQLLADGVTAVPGLQVLNDVVFTQVCVAASTDEATRALGEVLRADGVAFASSSEWHGRAVLRFSVSNAGTDDEAVAESLAALRRAAERIGEQ